MPMNLMSTPDFSATVENGDHSNVLCTNGIAAPDCNNSVTELFPISTRYPQLESNKSLDHDGGSTAW
jgi:hypothetical protein